MPVRTDRGPRVHHNQPPTDLPTLLEQFGAYRQSAGMCQPGSPEQRHYLDLANMARQQLTDLTVAEKLDRALGADSRPAGQCPALYGSVCWAPGNCPDCPHIPAEISRELVYGAALRMASAWRAVSS